MEVFLDENGSVRRRDVPVPLHDELVLGRFVRTGWGSGHNPLGYWTDRHYKRTGPRAYEYVKTELSVSD